MPRGDRTGPGGMGPMTGRGAGYCSGSAVPGFMNSWGGRGGGYGRGLGRGFGQGRGMGRGFGWYQGSAPMYAPPAYGSIPTVDPQAQASMLRTQAEDLKAQLSSIEREIEKLGSSKED